MKPTKNMYHCPYCGRPKMLFATYKKAMNFIKFNREEILEENGYAPIRAYYCSGCGGWHTTSHKSIKQRILEETDNNLLELEYSIIDMDRALGHGNYEECQGLAQVAVNKLFEYDNGYYSYRVARIRNSLNRIVTNLINISRAKAA